MITLKSNEIIIYIFDHKHVHLYIRNILHSYKFNCPWIQYLLLFYIFIMCYLWYTVLVILFLIVCTLIL